MTVDNPDWIADGIPDHIIEAGEKVLVQCAADLANYVPGETPDWDYGMEAAAVFKAMLRQALTQTGDA